eukprot:m.98075 g.98075  ORF g.98075 m.98075 type:complete len:294 (-) comp22078_c0_seq1:118-999(-)
MQRNQTKTNLRINPLHPCPVRRLVPSCRYAFGMRYISSSAPVQSASPFDMNIHFDGQRALVTGAGKGIGHDLTKLLANCGAEVIAVTRSAEDLDALKKEVPSIIPIQLDLSDAEATKRAISNAGDIDLLVNNAAIASLEAFVDTSAEIFDKIMAVNVRAPMLVSQLVAKNLISRGKPGAIVNVSSQASMAALQDHTAYCTSKAALDHLSRVMALELGQHNIRVNCVNPTVVLTAMGKMAWSDPVKADPMLAKIPLGKFAEVEDVTGVIAFLLSDKAAMINGVMVPIDGGFLAT